MSASLLEVRCAEASVSGFRLVVRGGRRLGERRGMMCCWRNRSEDDRGEVYAQGRHEALPLGSVAELAWSARKAEGPCAA